MEMTVLNTNDSISPDTVYVADWGYDVDFMNGDCIVFSFGDGKIWHEMGKWHKPIPVKDPLPFRYFKCENLLTVWIDDGNRIINKLREFESTYRNGEWKPFDIDQVQFIFTHNEYAVRCGFSELDKVETPDENIKLRGNLMLHGRNCIMRKIDKERPQEGDKAWIRKHGDIDPAHYHLLMYEE